MAFHPERFSYVMVDIGVVLKCATLDDLVRKRLQDYTINDTTRLMDDSSSFEERMRGGGPGNEVSMNIQGVDDDSFFMGFDLRRLENTYMGISLLPVDIEAMDHDDFDTAIDWYTVTRNAAPDGIETVQIAPTKPTEAAVEVKRQLLDFCIDKLQQRELGYDTKSKNEPDAKKQEVVKLSLEKSVSDSTMTTAPSSRTTTSESITFGMSNAAVEDNLKAVKEELSVDNQATTCSGRGSDDESTDQEMEIG